MGGVSEWEWPEERPEQVWAQLIHTSPEFGKTVKDIKLVDDDLRDPRTKGTKGPKDPRETPKRETQEIQESLQRLFPLIYSPTSTSFRQPREKSGKTGRPSLPPSSFPHSPVIILDISCNSLQ